MKRALSHILPLFTAACILSVTAFADDPVKRLRDDDKAVWSLQYENDVFAGNDQQYTNGVRAAYASAEDDVPIWMEQAADFVPIFPEGGFRRFTFSVGQSMFTPDDITIRAAQPDDRPYAGWLYGSAGLVSDTGNQLDNFQITVGLVGPSSQADATQEFMHDLIGSPDPAGWDNQLSDELGIVINYERIWRNYWELNEVLGLGVDVSPYAGLALGNVFTYGATGGFVRIGKDLPADYGPPRIRPAVPGSDFFLPVKSGLGWYFFAGAEGRAVARNLFLDGNTFKDSPSVDKYPLVGDLMAGAALTYRDTRIAFTHVLRSKEFQQQEDITNYSGITVSQRF